jgi:hypothetical protein
MKKRTETRARGRARTSMGYASLPKAFAAWRIAASKKSNKDDSGSDSEEEVNNDPSFLIAENARMNDLLDNRDDVLRKTNKEKREYRSLLGEAKEKVVELESLMLGLK